MLIEMKIIVASNVTLTSNFFVSLIPLKLKVPGYFFYSKGGFRWYQTMKCKTITCHLKNGIPPPSSKRSHVSPIIIQTSQVLSLQLLTQMNIWFLPTILIHCLGNKWWDDRKLSTRYYFYEILYMATSENGWYYMYDWHL